jgi:hypothetical protein
LDAFWEAKVTKMELKIHPTSHFLPTFSWTHFEVAFSRVEKVKMSVSCTPYAHIQGSKGTQKHSQNHQKNTRKPQKTMVKIESFFNIEISWILGVFGAQKSIKSCVECFNKRWSFIGRFSNSQSVAPSVAHSPVIGRAVTATDAASPYGSLLWQGVGVVVAMIIRSYLLFCFVFVVDH